MNLKIYWLASSSFITLEVFSCFQFLLNFFSRIVVFRFRTFYTYNMNEFNFGLCKIFCLKFQNPMRGLKFLFLGASLSPFFLRFFFFSISGGFFFSFSFLFFFFLVYYYQIL